MRRWITRQLRIDGTGPVVVIDPRGIVTDEELLAAFGAGIVMERVGDWLVLRRTWEREGRRRTPSEPQLVLLTTATELSRAEDLPFDIEQASTVCRIRIPGFAATHAALLALDPELSDRAADRIETARIPAIDAILTTAADLPPLPLTGAPEEQLRLALRLNDRTVPEGVAMLARAIVSEPLAIAALEEPPRFDDLQ